MTAAGGTGIAVQVDHLDPEAVAALVHRIDAEHERLDVLVNDVWGGDRFIEWNTPLWEQDLAAGLRMVHRAVDTHLITSHAALPLLIRNSGGLVVEMTDGTAEYNADHYRVNAFYDLAKAAVTRLAFAQSQDLAPHEGTAVALTPGWMRSEAMLDAFGVTEETWRDAVERAPHFAISETPRFVGRAVAALAAPIPTGTGTRAGRCPAAGWRRCTASPISTAPGRTAGATGSRCRTPGGRPTPPATAEPTVPRTGRRPVGNVVGRARPRSRHRHPDAGRGPGGLVADGETEVLAERAVPSGMRHAELLTPAITGVLDDAGLTMADLDAVVTGLGPGPFTGLRVGVVTAAALADARGLPVIGVCSLDAIGSGARMVVTDARRREIYWATYTADCTLYGGAGRRPVPGNSTASSRSWATPRSPNGWALRRRPGRDDGGAAAGGRGPAVRPVVLPPVPLYLRRPDATPPTAIKAVSQALTVELDHDRRRPPCGDDARGGALRPGHGRRAMYRDGFSRGHALLRRRRVPPRGQGTTEPDPVDSVLVGYGSFIAYDDEAHVATSA